MNQHPPVFKKWLISIRPFALPASTMPVIFGTLLAVVYGGYTFRPGLFLLALTGMVILHSAANLLSDVHDFNKGLDREPTPVSGGVVRGYISTRQARSVSILLFLTGTIIGFILTWFSGIWLLVIGIGGLFVGVFYTTEKRMALKYNGLGDFAVFLNFGILGSLGSWYVQAQTLSWIPVVWTIPMATLVIAILHANNWRDIQSDKKGDIRTVASTLGDRNSMLYYGFLIFGPFVMVLLFTLIPKFLLPRLPAMPLTFLITLLALPVALKLWKIARRRHNPHHPMEFIILDGATSRLNLQFGILCTLALLLNLFIHGIIQ